MDYIIEFLYDRNTQYVIYQARLLASSRKKKLLVNYLHQVSYKEDYYYIRISIERYYISVIE